VPEWRNGRRGGLKIRWSQGRVGSTPSSGTIIYSTSSFNQFPQRFSRMKVRQVFLVPFSNASDG
jgi:hypothetical protein